MATNISETLLNLVSVFLIALFTKFTKDLQINETAVEKF